MFVNVLPRILATVALVSAICTIPLFFIGVLSLNAKIAIASGVVLFSLVLTRFLLRDIREGLSALELGMLNLKDGEYATTLSYQNKDELGKLCELYNTTALQLRA